MEKQYLELCENSYQRGKGALEISVGWGFANDIARRFTSQESPATSFLRGPLR